MYDSIYRTKAEASDETRVASILENMKWISQRGSLEKDGTSEKKRSEEDRPEVIISSKRGEGS